VSRSFILLLISCRSLQWGWQLVYISLTSNFTLYLMVLILILLLQQTVKDLKMHTVLLDETEWKFMALLHLCYYKCYVKIQEPSTSPGQQCQKSHQIWNLYLHIILKVPNVRYKIYSYSCYAHQFYYPSCPIGISNIVLRQVRVKSLCKTRIQVTKLCFNQCCFAGWHNSRHYTLSLFKTSHEQCCFSLMLISFGDQRINVCCLDLD